MNPSGAKPVQPWDKCPTCRIMRVHEAALDGAIREGTIPAGTQSANAQSVLERIRKEVSSCPTCAAHRAGVEIALEKEREACAREALSQVGSIYTEDVEQAKVLSLSATQVAIARRIRARAGKGE